MKNIILSTKNLLFLLIFMLMFFNSYSQNNYEDVVYLKNGSIIRGIIIENIPNKSIKIETRDRNVFYYEISEIEKITKEVRVGKKARQFGGNGMEEGYKGIVELGYYFGVGDIKLDRLKVNIINGHQINPYFSIGIGTGIRYYTLPGTVNIPIFADLRGNFSTNNVSPFISIGIGHLWNASNDFSAVGLLLSPTFGASVRVSDNNFFEVGLTYEMQKDKIQGRSFSGESLTYGGFGIHAGLTF